MKIKNKEDIINHFIAGSKNHQNIGVENEKFIFDNKSKKWKTKFNPENYKTIYDIALEELKQKKIPFIIKRPINNTFEYWKLEDLRIL